MPSATLNFDLSQRDRIVILEDTDHDGRADRRTVFWDQGQRLTSVEVGFGGVWALCPPQLLFLPDRNGDDVPDGAARGRARRLGRRRRPAQHRQRPEAGGPTAGSTAGTASRRRRGSGRRARPTTSRTALNCCIWRVHPTRKDFEVVCQGTTNSWGMDWDEHGELFFINTVIGHLWHAIPGAHFERMYGEDFDPHLYGLIGQTADHYHWDTGETWNDIREGGSARRPTRPAAATPIRA